jgi:pimeloyl-ACP methyl ester carboxylesterase
MTTLPPTIERGIATAGADDALDAEPDLCQPAAAVVAAPPWRPGLGARPGRDEVTVIRHRPVGTTAMRAVSVVQYLASLPVWERKARRVTVDPRGCHGTYTACGRIAGFHSRMHRSKMRVQVAGGLHRVGFATAHWDDLNLNVADALHEEIPPSTLTVFPNAHHNLMLDDPTQFAAIVRSAVS